MSTIANSSEKSGRYVGPEVTTKVVASGPTMEDCLKQLAKLTGATDKAWKKEVTPLLKDIVVGNGEPEIIAPKKNAADFHFKLVNEFVEAVRARRKRN